MTALVVAMMIGLRDEGIRLEVIDPQSHYLTSLDRNVVDEVEWYMTYKELLKKAPPVSDAEWLPSLEVIDGMIAQCDSYHAEWSEKLGCFVTFRKEILGALSANEHDRALWTLMKVARGNYYISTKREALQDLRELLGAERYYKGDFNVRTVP
jgi:hypothetical protein